MRPLLILQGLLMVLICTGQGQNPYRGAFVRVASDIAEQSGIGLILFEQDDFLYIGVPRQYGISNDLDEASNIEVEYINRDGRYGCDLFYYSRSDQVAIVRSPKPSSFEWPFKVTTAKMRDGQLVGMLHPNDLWVRHGAEILGVVEQRDDKGARVQFYRLLPDEYVEGNLLFRRRRIAGMAYHHEEGEVQALSIEQLQTHALRSLDIYDQEMASMPLSIVGLAGMVVPSFDRRTNNLNGTLGGAVELGIRPRWSLRYGLQQYWWSSRGFVIDEGAAAARHRPLVHHFLLAWHQQSSLLHSTMGRFLVGYSLIPMDPQLSIDGGPYQEYGDLAGITVPKNSGAISLGVDWRSISFGGVTVGLQAFLLWPFSKYAYINPRRGLDPDEQRRGVSLEVSMVAGVGWRRKRSDIKFLREKKWFAFD